MPISKAVTTGASGTSRASLFWSSPNKISLPGASNQAQSFTSKTILSSEIAEGDVLRFTGAFTSALNGGTIHGNVLLAWNGSNLISATTTAGTFIFHKVFVVRSGSLLAIPATTTAVFGASSGSASTLSIASSNTLALQGIKWNSASQFDMEYAFLELLSTTP
jgi:hypothetical protein